MLFKDIYFLMSYILKTMYKKHFYCRQKKTLSRSSFIVKYVFLFVSIFCMIILLVELKTVFTAIHSYSFEQRLKKFQNCTEQAVYNYAVDFALLYLDCLDEHMHPSPDLLDGFGDGFNFKNVQFLKRHLPHSSDKCTWLSVGLDDDIGVESNFHTEYPECDRIGIDSSPEKINSFRQGGGIAFVGGLGVKEEYKVVRQHDIYKLQINTFTVFALSSFLDTHAHTRVIDYAFIDYRRMTFEILHRLFKGDQLEREGVVFCQFAVIIPWKLGSILNSDVVIHNLLLFLKEPEKLYIPIIGNVDTHHFTITFLNLRHEKCRQNFEYGNNFG